MTKFLDIEKVYTVHSSIIKRAKTKAGVRDFALLHSAVERPKATFQGKSLYPGIFAKATALLQSICLNHPFTDGNKRTAWVSTKTFLAVNGHHLRSEPAAAYKFMLRVDNEKPDLPEISSWLRSHST